ncbi:MAG: hypothetical protein BGO26_20055 [Actinobacteria bacterium 69-20]|nr:MAG: hypothetical protein BGO26_20055 [Actinobacteria bacterium 69-20]
MVTTARSRRRFVLRSAVVLMITVVVAAVGYGVLAYWPVLLLHTSDPAMTGTNAKGGVVGTVAPAIHGENYERGAVSVDPSAGGAVIVAVAHWCDHCKTDLREIADASAAGQFSLGEPLVAISTKHIPFVSWPPAKALGLNRFPGIVVVDTDASLAAYFRVSVTPTWFFTDRHGVIREVLTGELSPQAVKDHAGRAMSETEGG